MKLTEVPYILHLMIFPLGFLRMVLLGIFMIHSLRYISHLLLLGVWAQWCSALCPVRRFCLLIKTPQRNSAAFFFLNSCLTNLCKMDYPIFINWTSSFSI